MTIYVVTEGEYSDYKIMGVFTSKDSATSFVNGCDAAETEYKTPSTISIEEYESDQHAGEFYQKIWRVWMCLSSGNVKAAPEFDFAVYPRDWSHAEINDHTDQIYAESVVSAEHCLKIAAEARQGFLRQQYANESNPISIVGK